MRPLKADEIEVRVGQIYEKGVTMLLYKTARTDMTVLDEVYGALNWQKSYRRDENGILFCDISVWNDDTKEWVHKEDCGTESNTEKEKGEASDAMKRAGFNWGIGRELYTAPFIWLTVGTDPIGNGRYRLHNPRELNGIYVSHIATKEVNGRLTITELELSQRAQGKEMTVYQWKAK